ncbi:uncharacterized protein L969DRAFT_91390 [Mixia osmundae IAM 14324]|uniref:Carboxylesterase type B domain-containing protein n=1 Tax=Mixia osmundae (strain CBS 9802 / IAM 14324 / JCM 22182 / KY 12970) TaxID=764103 RepID=G7E778_MIXOS|nr:uncharacterized protein L969DRAFT_91390 [Mixia osmundae IAM 14324]KEI41918.1 hypothetical protein L969DRAFT_91390 [Mixia osmundae IAM 14324]GAA98688.1 hypothetical protein E5Q_05376 [Mixia osmundae IAM 14324]
MKGAILSWCAIATLTAAAPSARPNIISFSSSALAAAVIDGSTAIESAAEALLGDPQGSKAVSTSLSAAIHLATPYGNVTGIKDGPAYRYVLPYAKPPVGSLRLADPVALPNGTAILNGQKTPAACLQAGIASSSEDCLYASLYVPSSGSLAALPVFVWLEGGSFVSGSETAAGLDGATLAVNGNMIVVVLQYRLGILGFYRAPSLGLSGNYAVKDVRLALQVINNLKAFWHNSAKVTLAGQSSGAQLIKTLLTVPTADALFSQAILQSPPAAYGDQSAATGAKLAGYIDQVSGCSTVACYRAMSPTHIVNATTNVYEQASQHIANISPAEPIRPIIDGSLVVRSFDSAVNRKLFTRTDRSLIWTSVREEAAPEIYTAIGTSPVPSSYFPSIVQGLAPLQQKAVLASGLYSVNESDTDGTRNELTLLGTDYIWRCPIQQYAVNMTRQIPSIYLAQFNQGIAYPDNQAIPYCAGKVCHEDDIFFTFDDGASLNKTQAAISREITARYSAYAHTGSPNAAGYVTWSPVATATRLNLLQIDSISTVMQTQRSPQCGPNALWGRLARFDAQIAS